MNLQLVEPISTYFAASNDSDITHITDCFTQDAVVFDEGNTHRGYAAIQSWLRAARTKFEYSVEPLRTSGEKEPVTVVAKVSGNFPGSPIQLHYSFQLESGKIKSLEIRKCP